MLTVLKLIRESVFVNEISKEQFAKGTIWKVLERFTGRGISLVISGVLARILSPDDYGLIALTTVFTNLSEILIDGGFGTVLIRKKDVDEEDYACVLTISAALSTILYIILFISAPFIAAYYNKSEFASVLRVVSLVLFIQAFASTQNAYVTRTMQFKLMIKCNMVASVISGSIGIVFAFLGYGVWSLVIQRLIQQAVIATLIFFKLKWKLYFRFGKERFHEIFGFSAGVIGSLLINYIENCINTLVIGKHYSVKDLGYVDKAAILPEQISLNSFGAMTNVLLPTVSTYQNDVTKLKQIIRRVVKYTVYVLFPVMLGMLMVSREAICVIFSETWLPSVPIMQFICIYYIATPLMLIDVQVFWGLGHSNIRIKTEILRIIFIITGVVLCCFVFRSEIKYLSLSTAIAVCLGTIVTHIEIRKMIGYTFVERITDTYKSVISSIVMCFIVYALKFLLVGIDIPIIFKLIVEVVAGIFSYWLLSILFRIDVYRELVDIVRTRRRKDNG